MFLSIYSLSSLEDITDISSDLDRTQAQRKMYGMGYSRVEEADNITGIKDNGL